MEIEYHSVPLLEENTEERNDKFKAGSKIFLTIEHGYPAKETILIRQRLRNLFEIAIAIGQRQGLLHSYIKTGKTEYEED